MALAMLCGRSVRGFRSGTLDPKRHNLPSYMYVHVHFQCTRLCESVGERRAPSAMIYLRLALIQPLGLGPGPGDRYHLLQY